MLKINPIVFPLAMILLSIFASVTYLFARDYKRSIYWASAAVLTISVTI